MEKRELYPPKEVREKASRRWSLQVQKINKRVQTKLDCFLTPRQEHSQKPLMVKTPSPSENQSEGSQAAESSSTSTKDSADQLLADSKQVSSDSSDSLSSEDNFDPNKVVLRDSDDSDEEPGTPAKKRQKKKKTKKSVNKTIKKSAVKTLNMSANMPPKKTKKEKKATKSDDDGSLADDDEPPARKSKTKVARNRGDLDELWPNDKERRVMRELTKYLPEGYYCTDILEILRTTFHMKWKTDFFHFKLEPKDYYQRLFNVEKFRQDMVFLMDYARPWFLACGASYGPNITSVGPFRFHSRHNHHEIVFQMKSVNGKGLLALKATKAEAVAVSAELDLLPHFDYIKEKAFVNPDKKAGLKDRIAAFRDACIKENNGSQADKPPIIPQETGLEYTIKEVRKKRLEKAAMYYLDDACAKLEDASSGIWDTPDATMKFFNSEKGRVAFFRFVASLQKFFNFLLNQYELVRSLVDDGDTVVPQLKVFIQFCNKMKLACYAADYLDGDMDDAYRIEAKPTSLNQATWMQNSARKSFQTGTRERREGCKAPPNPKGILLYTDLVASTVSDVSDSEERDADGNPAGSSAVIAPPPPPQPPTNKQEKEAEEAEQEKEKAEQEAKKQKEAKKAEKARKKAEQEEAEKKEKAEQEEAKKAEEEKKKAEEEANKKKKAGKEAKADQKKEKSEEDGVKEKKKVAKKQKSTPQTSGSLAGNSNSTSSLTVSTANQGTRFSDSGTSVDASSSSSSRGANKRGNSESSSDKTQPAPKVVKHVENRWFGNDGRPSTLAALRALTDPDVIRARKKMETATFNRADAETMGIEDFFDKEKPRYEGNEVSVGLVAWNTMRGGRQKTPFDGNKWPELDSAYSIVGFNPCTAMFALRYGDTNDADTKYLISFAVVPGSWIQYCR
ncbi:unnamed protein product [Caenorhabditis nigoni]